MLCDIPGLLEDRHIIQSLSASHHDVSTLRENLLQRAASTLQQLCDLRWQWECEFPNACHEIAADPTIIYFRKEERANEIGAYNAVLLLVLELLESLDENPFYDVFNFVTPHLSGSGAVLSPSASPPPTTSTEPAPPSKPAAWLTISSVSPT